MASGESCSEHAVEPTSQDAARRFEHYELVTGKDGKPIELGRGAMGVTYNPSIWDPSWLFMFEGDTLVGLKGTAAAAELGRTAATFSTNTSRTELLSISFMVNGRYQVLEALGEGGMGVVYRVADQLHPERALALKTIQRAMLTAERIKMFKAEFRTVWARTKQSEQIQSCALFVVGPSGSEVERFGQNQSRRSPIPGSNQLS